MSKPKLLFTDSQYNDSAREVSETFGKLVKKFLKKHGDKDQVHLELALMKELSYQCTMRRTNMKVGRK